VCLNVVVICIKSPLLLISICPAVAIYYDNLTAKPGTGNQKKSEVPFPLR
jgi:hypothetical protein